MGLYKLFFWRSVGQLGDKIISNIPSIGSSRPEADRPQVQVSQVCSGSYVVYISSVLAGWQERILFQSDNLVSWSTILRNCVQAWLDIVYSTLYCTNELYTVHYRVKHRKTSNECNKFLVGRGGRGWSPP